MVKHRSGKLAGCSFNKTRKKWWAQIIINKKSVYLGYFNTEERAHEAYLRAIVMTEKGFTIEQIQEAMDIRTEDKCTSKHKGVSFIKARNKWWARITIEGKQTHLGYYSTELEAKEAYLKVKEGLRQEL
jgi:hypothetical protein